ncbi:MAG: protein kinase [Deltaproteobacteria bacterium]|nr:protein kinase [Deltaproteobacteria bacterium]
MPYIYDLTGTVLDRRYEITGQLGRGGMGHVYDARHVLLDQRVAIKVLHPRYAYDERYRERFIREARSASRIKHRNVVRISDFGDTPDGSVYFVMEFLEGRDVGMELERSGAMKWPRVRHILMQAVSALRAAHTHDIVHRDIKPGNCFLTTNKDEGLVDFVKLLDFGIAKVGSDSHQDGESKGLTGTGEVFGTAAYMSPEQVAGGELGPRSDMYSLGVMAYEMLTGKVPFTGVNSIHVITRHLNDAPAPPREHDSTIPKSVEALVLKTLAKDANDRYESMGALEHALRSIPESAGQQPQRRTRVWAGHEAERRPASAISSGTLASTTAATERRPGDEKPTTPKPARTSVVSPPGPSWGQGAGSRDPAPRPSPTPAAARNAALVGRARAKKRTLRSPPSMRPGAVARPGPAPSETSAVTPPPAPEPVPPPPPLPRSAEASWPAPGGDRRAVDVPVQRGRSAPAAGRQPPSALRSGQPTPSPHQSGRRDPPTPPPAGQGPATLPTGPRAPSPSPPSGHGASAPPPGRRDPSVPPGGQRVSPVPPPGRRDPSVPPPGQRVPLVPPPGRRDSSVPPPGQRVPPVPPPGRRDPSVPPPGQRDPSVPPPGRPDPSRPPPAGWVSSATSTGPMARGGDSAVETSPHALQERPSSRFGGGMLAVIGLLVVVVGAASAMGTMAFRSGPDVDNRVAPHVGASPPAAAVALVQPEPDHDAVDAAAPAAARQDAPEAVGDEGGFEAGADEPVPAVPADPAAAAPLDGPEAKGAGPEQAAVPAAVPSPHASADPEAVDDEVVTIDDDDPPSPTAETEPPSGDTLPDDGPPSPPAHETTGCRKVRDAAADAANQRQWSTLLGRVRKRHCWPPAEQTQRLRLHIGALLELERFSDCIKVGKRSKDPQIVRLVASCRKGRG